jgi:hypothetical protein
VPRLSCDFIFHQIISTVDIRMRDVENLNSPWGDHWWNDFARSDWVLFNVQCYTCLYITFLTVTTMLSIPVDVLQEILGHVHKADLPTLCRVNKLFCSCSRDVLYREIGCRDDVTQTLAQSTDLARRVRSFGTAYSSPELGTALRNMSSLRSLDLDFIGDESGDESVLDGCTFELESFACHSSNGKWLQQFLNSQPSLTNLTLFADEDPEPWFRCDARCLPNLTRVTAIPSLLYILIPGRPVREVIMRLSWQIDPIDCSFFALSTTPIQKLSIYHSMLYPKPVSLLVPTFPSLVHLVVSYDVECIVRAPLCLSI